MPTWVVNGDEGPARSRRRSRSVAAAQRGGESESDTAPPPDEGTTPYPDSWSVVAWWSRHVVSAGSSGTPHRFLRGLRRLLRPAASEVDPRFEAGCRCSCFGADQEPALHGPGTRPLCHVRSARSRDTRRAHPQRSRAIRSGEARDRLAAFCGAAGSGRGGPRPGPRSLENGAPQLAASWFRWW